jgi:ATP-binding cassette subfamily F protein 3
MMALITGNNLARSYGPDDIFDGISVSIPHNARIALVGPNGSGKTSLLRILAKLDEPTQGTVTHARGLRIGFLPQEAQLLLAGSQTLWEEMLRAFEDVLAQEGKLSQLADALAHRPGDADLLYTYGEAQTHFEAMGGYDYTTRIGQVLSGLGFDEIDFQRPLSQLSGGQKTRALLARLLLEQPDLLILDEPTNHLDIQAIEWLEAWLKDFDGALLMVSHDRYFMDSTVNRIWELIFGRLEEYRGNYSHYVQQREERHTYLLKEFERQQEFIAKEEDYIRRNIAGQNTRQAQGRRKRLERFLEDEAVSHPRQQRLIHLDLRASRRSGDKVLMTETLIIGYHDDRFPLFSVPDITLYRGECAALIGPNGVGKTSFLKTILGQLAPLEGEAKLGASVEIGYFAQAHEGLHQENTVLEEILGVQNMPVGEARNYLATFLFTGDDVYKPISILSGGERGRVALAKLALGGANLLLLDEPTNHLDIPSQEILEAVLADFGGTILLVSHDRYLIRNLGTQIWALHVPRRAGEGQTEMVVYEGSYDGYIAWREGRPVTVPTTRPKEEPGGKASRRAPSSSKPVPKPQLSAFERRRRLAQVEEQIHRLEVEMVNLTGALEEASSSGNVAEVARLGEAYSRTEAQLNGLMGEWETLLVET